MGVLALGKNVELQVVIHLVSVAAIQQEVGEESKVMHAEQLPRSDLSKEY